MLVISKSLRYRRESEGQSNGNEGKESGIGVAVHGITDGEKPGIETSLIRGDSTIPRSGDRPNLSPCRCRAAPRRQPSFQQGISPGRGMFPYPFSSNARHSRLTSLILAQWKAIPRTREVSHLPTSIRCSLHLACLSLLRRCPRNEGCLSFMVHCPRFCSLFLLDAPPSPKWGRSLRRGVSLQLRPSSAVLVSPRLSQSTQHHPPNEGYPSGRGCLNRSLRVAYACCLCDHPLNEGYPQEEVSYISFLQVACCQSSCPYKMPLPFALPPLSSPWGGVVLLVQTYCTFSVSFLAPHSHFALYLFAHLRLPVSTRFSVSSHATSFNWYVGWQSLPQAAH